MLELLRVQNIAIVEHADLEPGPGFTTITGETGSGKSVLMGALKLALGERAVTDVIREGAAKASAEAVFTMVPPAVTQWMFNNNLTSDEDMQELVPAVILRRDLTAAGQSRAYINNRPIPLSLLRELASQLIDIHGQHDSATLFSTAHQMRILDNFGGHGQLLEAYTEARSQYRSLLDKLQTLQQDAELAERRRAYLEFQIEEIGEANLCPGEEETLETERKRLTNTEHIITLCRSVTEMLYDSEQLEMPATTLISAAGKQLTELARLDDTQEELVTKAADIRFAIDDLAAQLRDYAEHIQADPTRLETVTERLSLIRSLIKKYGATVEDVIAHKNNCTIELDSILNRDTEITRLQKTIAPVETALTAAAAALTAKRTQTAKRFANTVTDEMQQLNLPQAILQVNLVSANAATATLPETGAETCEFLIQINLGESPKSLRKVASGGEISRIMLAIKCVIADKDDIQTLIFDEIDTGISGDAAGKVGDKLATLGQTRQVIAITHLPQIAVRGTTHLVVDKTENDNRTHVTIGRHEGKQRAHTIATMIVGHPPDEDTIAYAQTLLQRTQDTQN